MKPAPRHAVHNRLPRWHRRSLYALTALLLLSGLAWLGVVYLLALPGEPTPAPHALAGPLLAAHGIAAYMALVAFALVGQAHLRAGWKLPAMRRPGLCIGLALLALMISALGLYYSGNESLAPWWRWVHVGVGLALPGALAWHIVRARRLRSRA